MSPRTLAAVPSQGRQDARGLDFFDVHPEHQRNSMSGCKVLTNVMAASAVSVGLVVTTLGEPSHAPRYDAASNYAIHCMGCHRADGSGSPPDVPSLRTDLPWMLRSSAGREYVMRVPGVAGSPMSDAETTAVLNWLAEAFVPGAKGTPIAPFTESEVAAARHRPLLDVRTERTRLLAERRTALRLP